LEGQMISLTLSGMAKIPEERQPWLMIPPKDCAAVSGEWPDNVFA
jgi:hypothetical protein